MENQEMLAEYKRCAEFPYFCEKYLTIFNPMHGSIPFKLYGYQREKVLPAYRTHRFNIIKKFRQGGLSVMTAAYCLWVAIFNNEETILIISKSDREAVNFMRMVREFFNQLPEWLKPPVEKNNEHQLWFSKKACGSKIVGFTPVAGRSYTATLLVIDEAAFIKKMENNWSAIYPTLSTGGRCIIISTVNGTLGDGKWYFDMYQAALKKQNKFNVIDLKYTEHPDYSKPGWAEEQLAAIGEKRFRQEVLGDFEGSRDTYISNSTLKRLVDGIEEPAHKLLNERLHLWLNPSRDKTYIIAADVSEGLGTDSKLIDSDDIRKDNSCFHVFEAKKMEQVAEFYSNSTSVVEFGRILAQVGRHYNEATIAVESNSIGGSVLTVLREIEGYENLYGDGRRDGVHIGSNRASLLNKMRTCLDKSLIRLRSERCVGELKAFEWNERSNRAQAPRNGHDDLIMALAIASMVRDEQIMSMPVGIPDEDDDPLINQAWRSIRESETQSLEDELRKISGMAPKELIYPEDKPFAEEPEAPRRRAKELFLRTLR